MLNNELTTFFAPIFYLYLLSTQRYSKKNYSQGDQLFTYNNLFTMVLTRNQNKRQKSMGDSLGNLNIIQNDDLLQKVASYLPKTSVALFATLFTDPNEKRPSTTSKAIVSQKDWETIDFEDMGEELRIKLNDEDVRVLLLAIDAKNKLKTLDWLPPTLTGHGLIPLRGSVVLENLFFVDFHSRPQVSISMKEVLPIIESIVSKNNNSLEQFAFPEERLNGEEKEVLCKFTAKHKRKLAGCNDCNLYFCIGSDSQGHSCQKCGKKYCKECCENSGYGGTEYPCDVCNRYLCGECSGGLGCAMGGAMACTDCCNAFDDYDY